MARRHLWMHFTRMGAYGHGAEIPIIVRGEGCYVYDEHGKRYLDGLSALFCVNAGHGRAEIGDAAAAQAKRAGLLHQLELRPSPRDRARRADRRSWRRGDLNRVFFTSGGSRGGRVGLKLSPRVPQPRHGPSSDKLIAREIAYHGTTLGALAATGIDDAAGAVRAARSRRLPRAEHERLPLAGRAATRSGRPTRSRSGSSFEGPETVAAVILEPVQNAGGCFVAARTATSSACARSATATACC